MEAQLGGETKLQVKVVGLSGSEAVATTVWVVFSFMVTLPGGVIVGALLAPNANWRSFPALARARVNVPAPRSLLKAERLMAKALTSKFVKLLVVVAMVQT